MADRKVLNLIFSTNKNSSTKITITKPVLNISTTTISQVMDQIVAFGTLDGVVDKKAAEYVTTLSEKIHIY